MSVLANKVVLRVNGQDLSNAYLRGDFSALGFNYIHLYAQGRALHATFDNICVSTYGAGGRTGNDPPVVDSYTVSPTSGTVPFPVSFTCKAHDPDGSISVYKWDFNGDGHTDYTTRTGSTTHTYQTPGTYYTTCTVVDNDGATAKSKSVKVTASKGSGGGGGGSGCEDVPVKPSIRNVDPNNSPVNIGSDAYDGILSEGESMAFSINFPCYDNYVDLYVAISVPVSPFRNLLLFVSKNNEFVVSTGDNPQPFRSHTKGPEKETLFSELPVSNPLTGEYLLPRGVYIVYTLVTPSGMDLSRGDWSNKKYELLYYTFSVQ